MYQKIYYELDSPLICRPHALLLSRELIAAWHQKYRDDYLADKSRADSADIQTGKVTHF